MGGPDQSASELCRDGLSHHQAGRLAEAEALYRQALTADPNIADALAFLGVVAHQQGRGAEGLALVTAAITLNGANPNHHNNASVVLAELGRYGEAEASARAAIDLAPDFPAAHYNRGNALEKLGRFAEAEASYRRALAPQPNYADALNNLGHVLNVVGRSAEAESLLRRALASRPDSPATLNNLGIALAALGRPREAIAAYREALRLSPDFPDAHNNLGYALLLVGDFEQGWEEHEWRWRMQNMAPGVRDFAAPPWRGEPLEGRTLLLHAEQGLGDTLQFCRYASIIARQGRVVLEVQPPLARLASRMAGVAAVVARGETLPPFDAHLPLLSAPRALRTRLETIPAHTPYLEPDPAEAAAWRARLAALPGPRVGLVWAGASRDGVPALAAIDARRSAPLAALAPLAEVAGVSFVSLQKGAPAGEATEPPAGLILHDFTADLDDFADTAALIANLDLVISVDTSVAHLAGAMGKPIWLLNRYDTCWRWLLGRDDSPWYPSLRQFRQTAPGDWPDVIERVRDALRVWANGRIAEGRREVL
jgi:Flp pilus assembly protein TadD